ncbi:DnaJ domain-containing protein [Mycotypha africana]|uniref:DnaJ domain-containing protein n=1 Tax=Mycotypha africana TaxID=64632 RepID=UPI002301ACF8|nr:DnaJ domain-containing protein [Mycotypha africana]KAI8988453.1 DnaJ domain-containing protein [Mycotypha africana]
MFARRSFHTTTIRYKNYYEILNLRHNADRRAIKSSYYKLSKKYHPDLNPKNNEAHKKFVEINEAYAVLGNEANKRKYDFDLQHGSVDTGAAPFGGRRDSNSNRAYAQAAWHFKRRAPKATGTKSAQEQAEKIKYTQANNPGFNHSEHFNRHYEAEEHRRRIRIKNATRRRKEAGETIHEQQANDSHNTWNRFWRLALILSGIAYATQAVN